MATHTLQLADHYPPGVPVEPGRGHYRAYLSRAIKEGIRHLESGAGMAVVTHDGRVLAVVRPGEGGNPQVIRFPPP